MGRPLHVEKSRYFKITTRAAQDAMERGGSGLFSAHMRSLIEDACVEALERDKLIPPFETVEGPGMAFFVRMDPDEDNDLEVPLYLVVTEDDHNHNAYAVVAGWTADHYEKKRSATGLGGGLRLPSLSKSNTLPFMMPKTPLPPPAVVPPQELAESFSADLASLHGLVSTLIDGIRDADFQVLAIQGDNLCAVRYTDDQGAIGDLVEELLQAGFEKDQIKITKTLRPKIRVAVDFE